ncbi:MAG: hypothetical protein ACI9EF_001678, partial [Pseudohongiellaceae bacterium]
MAHDRAPRPLPIVGKPWFWVLFIGTLFSLPFFKSTQAELPDPLPGMNSPPLEFQLPREDGQVVALSDLAGTLAVVTELPLANGAETEATFAGIRRLNKRLRGLSLSLSYVILCHGGTAAQLDQLLKDKIAQRPNHYYLLDDGGAQCTALRQEAGSFSADFFLIDRHGRLRGLYENTEEDID